MSEHKHTNTCGCGKKTDSTANQSCGIQNGKGDAPRNISQKFRQNYEEIFGKKKKK
jgi:hypothetical protein